MGISGSPYGSITTLVDKVIGTPYEIVKYVADRMGAVMAVADYLVELNSGCPSKLAKRSAKKNFTAGNLGSVVEYPLPCSVKGTDVIGVTAILTLADGTRYFNDSRFFHTHIVSNSLVFTLRPDALVGMVGSTVDWFVTFEV